MNNTIENNKLIAEFMGFRNTPVRNYEGKQYEYQIPYGFNLIKEVETTIEGVWVSVLEEQDYCMVTDLKFNVSWDWLMPVVAKCAKAADYYEFDTEENKKYEEIFNIENMFTEFMRGNIAGIYERAIEFIKWYNENRNKQTVKQ